MTTACGFCGGTGAWYDGATWNDCKECRHRRQHIDTLQIMAKVWPALRKIAGLPTDAPRVMAALDAAVTALQGRAQQPAAGVGEVKCPWDGGSPCVEPMPARMVYPKKPAPRAGGYLDTSGVKWSAWDAGQMEAYARTAYSDGWEAGYRAALAAQQEDGGNG